MKRSSASPRRMPQRRRDLARGQVGRVRGPSPPGSARELVVQRGQRRVAARDGLAPEPVEQVRAPLGEVHDPRRHALGVQREAQDVDRRLEQVLGDAGGQQRDRAVARRPSPSGGRRRPRGTARGPCRTRSSASRTGPISGSSRSRCAVGRRVAGGEQQLVALAQRHVELLGQVQDHARRSGVERPVSTKLRCRADTSASSARSICVMRRRCRQSRSSAPTAGTRRRSSRHAR